MIIHMKNNSIDGTIVKVREYCMSKCSDSEDINKCVRKCVKELLNDLM